MEAVKELLAEPNPLFDDMAKKLQDFPGLKKMLSAILFNGEKFPYNPDVLIDYYGRQYICELKIWHGREYNERGEKQLIGYLDDYHLNEGYMVSFNFNKNKQARVRELVMNGKKLVEAVV